MATITSGGLGDGRGQGTSTIQATLGSISGSTSLTVTAVLESIAVTPANASIARGRRSSSRPRGCQRQQHAEPDQLGDLDFHQPAVATITSGGLATGWRRAARRSGDFRGDQRDTCLTVTAATLQSIAVTPANSSSSRGDAAVHGHGDL